MMKTDVAIIGAGPVGLFAIFQCGMLKLDVHVFDALNVVGGQCATLYPQKPIYDIPAHPMILGQDLVDHLKAQAQPFHPTYHMEQKVTHIEPLAPNDGGYLWQIQSNQGVVVQTKAIIIAAGVGAFGPNRPPLDDIESYENKTIHYFIADKMAYHQKHVMIAGGGDSALDWALALKDIAASVTLVHRRSKFRAAPDTVDKIMHAVENGQIILKAPYQLHGLSGRNGLLEQVSLCHFETQDVESVRVDYLLPFFGLSMNLGPIAEWGLGLTNKHIQVDQATAQTNKQGIYAIGDVATYPHKLKLILTGFAEAAQAAHSIRHQIYPDQVFHFEYSTTMGLPKTSV
ncbi:MAG: NAD(P)/FAD-dependent oxidoreductase [Alphaproteobacteria bacterium]|nr:NAD(P)/FAD-dependent oxidoreductase [Alphaproteobacteria bacterium]